MGEQQNNTKDHELEKIRLRKMKALIEAQKRQQAAQNQVASMIEKVNYLLKVVLSPDAYSYLMKLKENEPKVYQYIFNELITSEVISNIDYLIGIITARGGVPRRIPLDVIIYLERQAKGIKSQIRIKRSDGEMMDLRSYLTKE
ncbi:MAG: hypothetical protein ACTSVV_12295 [Promethearchaeota archaeon]